MRRQVEASLKTTSENHRKNSEKLSGRQNEPLGGQNEQSGKVLDNIELPGWVHEVLSMSPSETNLTKRTSWLISTLSSQN